MSTLVCTPVEGPWGAGQRPDTDPEETREWLASLDALVAHAGLERAESVVMRLLAAVDRAQERRTSLSTRPTRPVTDFVNTIAAPDEAAFPGDNELERRSRALVRWNAAVMVSSANRGGLSLGGHIATYASAATLYEIGYNHFFRGKDHPGGGDQVFFQGHASPGIYARAFLMNRLSADHLRRFRQEVRYGRGQGLSSYPHPRNMPDFWEFPTVSMGLGALNAIYQARFNRYLHNRGLADTSQQHVWAFLGDGETAEVEALGAIGVAAREGLDNLTFVLNANLQQLDGPVRGNGKIIQELEALFHGAGWNVIKAVWGRAWDPLLAADADGLLVDRMNEVPDGQFQTYSVESGAFIREDFFGTDPRLRAMVEHLSDRALQNLPRGGHDDHKVYAAYRAALDHVGAPTLILAHTIKGWMIDPLEGRNATHQMKKLDAATLKAFRDRLKLPVTDRAIDAAYEDGGTAPYYHPGDDDAVIRYMREHRERLGGWLPQRRVAPRQITLPGEAAYGELRRGSGKQAIATTMAFVRQLKTLMKDPEIGPRIVPIAPDEYRTFGMDSLFSTVGIYNPAGQRYQSVDHAQLMAWRESTSGQLIHEGISEAGAVATATAAGSAYATHGEPMIPVYLFYSMFGFQRTGDGLWAMTDQLARGFLIGATAGRTTLTGEGLQHADGHSPLLAAAVPAIVHYDPGTAYEIAHIMRDGLRRMYGASPEHPHGEDVVYYLTVYNEPQVQPPEPADLDVAGLLKGMYRLAGPPGDPALPPEAPRVRLLASGVALPWIWAAQRMLAQDWGVAAELWSVTSWNELARDAMAVTAENFTHPATTPRVPYVTQMLAGDPQAGPVVAVSDFMRAVPQQIAAWVPAPYVTLGADGYGFSDSRRAARRYFRIDAESIAARALQALADTGAVSRTDALEAWVRYRLDDTTVGDAARVAGAARLSGAPS